MNSNSPRAKPTIPNERVSQSPPAIPTPHLRGSRDQPADFRPHQTTIVCARSGPTEITDTFTPTNSLTRSMYRRAS